MLTPLAVAILQAYAASTGVAASRPAVGAALPPERAWREAAAACAAEPMRAKGAVTYFCDCGPGAAPGCQPGDDSNVGLSPTSPKRTGFQATFARMPGGATVALCRGGSFAAGAVRMRNASCRRDRTCDMRDYAAPWNRGGEDRPMVRGPYVGWFPDDGAHYEGYRFLNLQASTSGGQGSFFFAGDTTDVEVCNVRFVDGDLGVYWAAPEKMRRIVVRGSQFERLATGVLGGCSDCALDANYFDATSYKFDDMRQHPVYVSGVAKGMRVTNNEIHGNRPGRPTRSGSALVVVHGVHEDLLIENNLVQADGLLHGDGAAGTWGISVGHGAYTNAVPSHYRRTVIRRNRVVNTGAFAIELGQCADCVVESNVVVMPPNQSGWTGIMLGFTGPREGIPAPGDDLTTRCVVRNNTIYFPGGAGTGIAVRREGEGHAVANNAIYFGGTRGQCLELPLPQSAYALVARNACNGTWPPLAREGQVTVQRSPFLDPVRGDLAPRLGGPLAGGGTPGQRPDVDLAGRRRPATPSIGALEPPASP